VPGELKEAIKLIMEERLDEALLGAPKDAIRETVELE
jgi:hypothetical protein